MKSGGKEAKAGSASTREQNPTGGRNSGPSSGKTNNSGTRIARHIVIAQKIGVSDILEEMI